MKLMFSDPDREITYYPKGAIANSYFTDSFKLKDARTGEEVDLVTTDISWKSDRDSKFLRPDSWKSWDCKFNKMLTYWSDEFPNLSAIL